MSINPLLTILIPAIPERLKQLQSLMSELGHQIESCCAGNEVEVISLLDNKWVPIGTKRQRLLDMASGKYVTFIDDDDWISDVYLSAILEVIHGEHAYDLITFAAVAYLKNDTGETTRHTINQSIKFKNEQINHERPTKRKPVHNSVWLRTIAQQSRFPATMYGEDFEWAEKLWDLVQSEKMITLQPLYIYDKA